MDVNLLQKSVNADENALGTTRTMGFENEDIIASAMNYLMNLI